MKVSFLKERGKTHVGVLHWKFFKQKILCFSVEDRYFNFFVQTVEEVCCVTYGPQMFLLFIVLLLGQFIIVNPPTRRNGKLIRIRIFFFSFFFIYISVCVTNANCVVEEIYKTWPQERMCLIDNEKIRGKGTTWLSLPVKLFRWVSPFRDGVGGQYHTLHRKMHGKCRAKSCGRGCFEFITVIYSINVTVNLCCCGNTFVIWTWTRVHQTVFGSFKWGNAHFTSR